VIKTESLNLPLLLLPFFPAHAHASPPGGVTPKATVAENIKKLKDKGEPNAVYSDALS